jgi:hypothetical protein
MWLLLFYLIIVLAPFIAAEALTFPGAYILQLSPMIDFSNHPFPVLNTHVQAFHTAATDIQYTVRYEFNNPDVFLGVSIQVTDTGMNDDDMRILLCAVPGVISVAPVGIIGTPRPSEKEEVTFSDLMPFVSTASPKLPGPFKGGGLSSSLRMGGIDKLHKLGIKGKGIKLGIIDSGIDYRHPALGGAFGRGNKIAGGHAFVGDWGEVIDKRDPLITCPGGGHGTHVAGKITCCTNLHR